MPLLQTQIPVPAETTCGSLLQELQRIWDELGEGDHERDKMLLQLEQECLDVYRRKVDQASKHKASLHQALADAEAEATDIISALGEHSLFTRPVGTLKEKMSAISPTLEDLRHKKKERVKELSDVQLQIVRICGEIAGNVQLSNSVTIPQVDKQDLSLKRLGELKSELQELQKEKALRLQKVCDHVHLVHDLSAVMSCDFQKTIIEVHPSLDDSSSSQPKSISNDTLARLAGCVHSLKQEKQQRLQKLQDMGSTMVELWNLMDTPVEEQKPFDHVTCLISASVDKVSGRGSLALDVIKQAEIGVERLDALKASKMKELVLKKQNELEEIYLAVHMDVDSDSARQILISLIESGSVDLSELLSGMDDQIAKAKEQAQSRKEILEKVEKWSFAIEEENWLEEYERDQNRYSAGRGAHKNLKRAEKARILVSKIPSLVETLTTKIKAWEEEKGFPFLYDKAPLLETLEEYTILRQDREEEKRRSREQKRLQEQFATEQEALFGSKPSPMRPLYLKKPLGHNVSGGTANGTPTNRRLPVGGARSAVKDGRKESGRGGSGIGIPVNYVALSKDDCNSHNTSTVASP
ncbi:65-kDa microtubule-associated protein 1 [Amborella trichopoda]|uniref:Microtubule-associated protein MAP65-1a n=1 Tax=Amborella trichopoda TaxID=13333 RepID=W1NWL5_AMBTC|nr:65-kDa microtubule-associated protein 1 [Amborella trichopoda]ERM99079.1 hypothetical protein AMTR_s00101p00107070 [Amborella trichopoda]|eukprot:XP_006836226.1 65-kDa microtubule-associated protein 1 [Amborella trichopoda]